MCVFSNAFILCPGEFWGAVPPSSGQQTTSLETNDVMSYNLCYMHSLSLSLTLISYQQAMSFLH